MFGMNLTHVEQLHDHMNAVVRKGVLLALIICVCNMLALVCAFCAGAKMAKAKYERIEAYDVEERPVWTPINDEQEEETRD